MSETEKQPTTTPESPDNTTETSQPPELSEQNQKNFTVKDAYVSDQEFIKSFTDGGKKKMFEALHEVVELAKRGPEIKEVEKEVVKEITKEVEKLVEKQLLPNQVIVNLTENTNKNIRKCRPFISKQNYLVYEKGNNQDFIDKLVNKAINRALKIDFDHIINPL